MKLSLRQIGLPERGFARLQAAAEAEGFVFLRRLEEEWESSARRFDRAGEILVGAYSSDQLVGLGGISLDPYSPAPGLGRVRHVYVDPRFRRRKVATALMTVLLAHARTRFDRLRLSTSTLAAGRFYEGLGFEHAEAEKQSHRLSL